MAAISSSARAAAFDWNDSFSFFMYLNTELLKLCRKYLCYETKSKRIKWRSRHFVSGSFEKVA